MARRNGKKRAKRPESEFRQRAAQRLARFEPAGHPRALLERAPQLKAGAAASSR